jgi:tetratricopeptide (TPR) repeat protein
MALPILWITCQTQGAYGNYNVVWAQRPLVALNSAGFYIQNFFLPLRMKADYGNTPSWIVENMMTTWTRLVWIALSLATLFTRRFRDFGWAVVAFLVLFSPISGMASFTFQQISNVADRYMYLPILPLAWGFANQMGKTGLFKTNQHALISFLVISLGFLFISFPRVAVWETNERFFRAMLQDHPQSYSAHLNLASIDQKRGDLAGAIEHVNKAALYAPNNLNVTLSVYILLSHLGRHQKVLDFYNGLPEIAREKYSTSDPLSWANFLTNVSVSQFALGQDSASLETTCEALHLDPQSQPAKRNLEILKNKLNRTCAAGE